MNIPLFPLHTVVLPEGQLRLRLFEPRYLDMLTNCLRDNTGFGVCLIRDGREAGGTAEPFEQGTLVSIADWDKGEDGLLHITAVGERKFRLLDATRQPDNLLVGNIECLPAEESCSLPDEHRNLALLLERVFSQMPWNNDLGEPRFEDALWVGSRLLEILPLPRDERYAIFCSEDALQRVEKLAHYIKSASANPN